MTGGANHIGRAVIDIFAGVGSNVVIADHAGPGSTRVAADIAARLDLPLPLAVTVDIRDPTSFATLGTRVQ